MKSYTSISLCLSIAFIVSCQSNPSYQSNSSSNSKEKSLIDLKEEVREREKIEATRYISGNYSVRENLIGEQVIEGTLTNNADMASFKDIILEITFLSKTGTALDKRRNTIFELLTPGKTVKYKLKRNGPKQTANCSVAIIDAIAIQ